MTDLTSVTHSELWHNKMDAIHSNAVNDLKSV